MKRVSLAAAFFFAFGFPLAGLADPEKPYDFEETPWKESETLLPDFPKPERLLEFSVGTTEHNRFFVDGSSITVGTDGIVRYVLVLKTPGGASNVTLEGIRCETREYKLYAVGLPDDTWSRLRNPQWRLIENKQVNQYRAVLNREYFCPAGLARDAAGMRAALRRGLRP